MWKCNDGVRKWKLCRPCDRFRDKYDEVEKLKAKVGCMDDLLTGTTIKGFALLAPQMHCIPLVYNFILSGHSFLCHSGMLSKCKGQILRIAVTLHVLFNWETPHNIPDEISDSALKAAVNFVDVCVQHAAYLGGRGDIQEEAEHLHQTYLGNPFLRYYNNRV